MSDVNLFLAEANENFKIIVVKFPSSAKQYHYKTILDVSEGDLVVVESPSGFVVVEALEVLNALETELSYNFQIKWLVSKVDVEEYQKCIDAERAAIKTLNQLKYSKRRKELLHNMQEDIGVDGITQVRQLVKL